MTSPINRTLSEAATKPRYLVWDCEMTPATAYIWDLRIQGGYLNKDFLISRKKLLCVAAKFTGPDEPMHFFSGWADGMEGMLHGMRELLEQAAASVTFNGLQADCKWLSTECALAGLEPLPPVKQIDVYRVLRSRFALMSNSLAYACKEFGVRDKTDSGGLQTIVAASDGDEDARARLSEYCMNDVTITEQLFHRVRSFIPNLPVVPLIDSLDGPRCSACGSHALRPRGYAYTKTGRFRRYVCECGKWVRSTRRDAYVEITEIAA